MEHLDIPEEHRSNAVVVPYIGIAPPYDNKGFIGFPERHGITAQQLLNYSSKDFQMPEGANLPFSNEYLDSFLQEWMWVGMLHEFELACGVPLDRDAFIKPGIDGQPGTVTTERLIQYVRSVVIDHLVKRGIPLGLMVGDWVYISYPPYNSSGSGNRSSSKNDRAVPASSKTASSGQSTPRLLTSEASSRSGRPTNVDSPKKVTINPHAIEPRQIIRDLGGDRYVVKESRLETQREISLSFLSRTETAPPIPLSDLVKRLETVSLGHLRMILFNARATITLDHNVEADRFAKCLAVVRRNTWLLLSRSDETDLVPDWRVMLSIDILWDSLREFMGKVFNFNIGYASDSFFYLRLFSKQMQTRNWCRARHESLTRNLTTLYLKSLLPSHETVSHSECGPLSCERSQPLGACELSTMKLAMDAVHHIQSEKYS